MLVNALFPNFVVLHLQYTVWCKLFQQFVHSFLVTFVCNNVHTLVQIQQLCRTKIRQLSWDNPFNALTVGDIPRFAGGEAQQDPPAEIRKGEKDPTVQHPQQSRYRFSHDPLLTSLLVLSVVFSPFLLFTPHKCNVQTRIGIKFAPWIRVRLQNPVWIQLSSSKNCKYILLSSCTPLSKKLELQCE